MADDVMVKEFHNMVGAELFFVDIYTGCGYSSHGLTLLSFPAAWTDAVRRADRWRTLDVDVFVGLVHLSEFLGRESALDRLIQGIGSEGIRFHAVGLDRLFGFFLVHADK
jgi:hypothetical protein